MAQMAAAQIREHTALTPQPGPAEIVAAYCYADPAPQELLPLTYGCDPVELFHKVAIYLAFGESSSTSIDTAAGEHEVRIQQMDGFDLTVWLPQQDAAYIFDATQFYFSRKVDDDCPLVLQRRELNDQLLESRLEINSRLRGMSSKSPEENLTAIHALLDLSNDMRPAILIKEPYGHGQTAVHVRAARAGRVILDVYSPHGRINQYLFDLDRGELDFTVSQQNPTAYKQFLHALSDRNQPAETRSCWSRVAGFWWPRQA